MNIFNTKKCEAKPLNLKKLLQYCVTATLPFCLTGCMGIYEGGFECPPGKGVGCKSISEVNSMVDHGDLPERSSPDLPQTICEQCGSNRDQQIDPKHTEKLEIWYAPAFNADQKEKRKSSCLDESHSI